MTRDRPLLEVRGLTYRLPGRTEPLFSDLDLEVRPGEVVVLMGGSGSGKSTLADLIFGLRPRGEGAGGQIHLDQERAALLLQAGAVFEHLSVGENLALVLRRAGQRPVRARVAEALRSVGLGHLDPCGPSGTLSGGEKRRLALARALCADPDLLVFDEPSAGLDLDNVRRQADLIRSMARERGKGVLVVTHDPLLAARAADRVSLLERGRLVEVGQWRRASEQIGTRQEDGRSAPEREAARLAELEQTTRGRFGPAEAEIAGDAAPGARAGRRFRVPSPLVVGDYVLSGLRAIGALPSAMRHLRDLAAVGGRTLWLAGVGGVPFFALIGAILGATFIMILLGASILPARITLDKVQAVPLTALAAPLAGFLFAARSGSAVASWLGQMSHSRQVDALRTLSISPDGYLRAPVWAGLAASFLLAVAVLFGAMWAGAWMLCRFKVGISDPAPYLQPFGNPQITVHAAFKLPLYAALTATVTTHIGLSPMATGEAVARAITRVIIVCAVGVALTELLFAALLTVGGGR